MSETPLGRITDPWTRKDKFGLTSLDSTQVEEVHKLLFSDLDLVEFKKTLGRQEFRKRPQFINGCFFIYETQELKSKYS